MAALYGQIKAPSEGADAALQLVGISTTIHTRWWIVGRESQPRSQATSATIDVTTRTTPLRAVDRFTLLAVRVDPADSSHLLLDYVLDGEAGHLDLWLVDTTDAGVPGAAVEFADQQGPLRTRNWSQTGGAAR